MPTPAPSHPHLRTPSHPHPHLVLHVHGGSSVDQILSHVKMTMPRSPVKGCVTVLLGTGEGSHTHARTHACMHAHTCTDACAYAHTHTQPSMHTPTHNHLHIHYTQGKTHWHARSPTCDICSQFSTHIPMISTLTEECTIHPVGQSATASLTHDQCCWSAPWPQTEPELHTYTRTHAHASWGNQKQQMP